MRDIVFYAEDDASYLHFQSIINELINSHRRHVCYLTSYHKDPILNHRSEYLHPFYVGHGFVPTHLLLNLKARIMILTMPDLEAFHLKRSKRYPVHYVYVFHSMVSTHMIYRKGAFDNYDTIFCVGPHHVDEMRQTEKVYELKAKNLVEHGYGRLDTLLEESRNWSYTKKVDKGQKTVVVAPSWHSQGLLETKGVELVDVLLNAGCCVIVRPHPMTNRKWPDCISTLKNRFLHHPQFSMEETISDANSFCKADCMISDFSGAALEFAFAYEKPVIFVDVPRKINNLEYERIACEPLEVSIRTHLGAVVGSEQLSQLPQTIHECLRNSQKIAECIRELRRQYVYHIGQSGKVAADWIQTFLEKQAK